MATRVRLVFGSHYIDQDGNEYQPGQEFETDDKEAQALIAGGSAVRVDAHGHTEET